MIKKIKNFLFSEKIKNQAYSFIKTYVTLFLGIYLTLHNVIDNYEILDLPRINLTDLEIIKASAEGAFISILRNIYKLLTE